VLSVCCGRGPLGNPVTVIGAERTWQLFRQRVAVALAVGGAHECGDDVERPFLDARRLTPEVGETQVDIELEQIYP